MSRSVKIKRRILFYVILTILPAVILMSCQKRIRVANSSLVPQPRSDYDRFAHVIVDVCHPDNHSKWLKSGSESERFARLFCTVGMEKLAANAGAIRDEKLKKLINKYSNGFKPKED